MEFILKNKIIVVGILVAIFTGWWFLSDSSNSATQDPLLSTTTEEGALLDEGGDLVQSLTSLEHLTFDTSIFSNPAFMTLNDFSITIQQESMGREDPFMPIGDIVQNRDSMSAVSQFASSSRSSSSTQTILPKNRVSR